MIMEKNKELTIKSPFKSNILVQFNAKTGPFQVLWLLIECFAVLICVILIISSYMIRIPEIEIVGGTIPKNPGDIISFQQLPDLVVSMDVIGSVTNNNLFPVPASIYIKGAIDSNNPADRTTIQAPVTGKINLFEPGSRTLRLIFDACDIFSTEGGRSTLKANIYADAYLGYGIFSVYLKTINTVVELTCPLIDQNLSEVILGSVNNLLF
ncbi:hypothetical protein CONCODRAFT_8823 [Conidiobolus coronatus NRRL 28638]|uniref:Uncharacterized protein n=1 Tax=Conidiobolus coronatus (strain ATCC 28846 / CBS 209.66 / NRRL 28638) TaxID=796925 RepID=A0A137P1U9_CONC2|nr:hypothetical protein CONCODRAFT_8823 [Conidiobolus coronatus NRRL 28638]|eukprot:KXN68859.1 hypothetical protein CONCODRAFT_8823 [Conidiobolus coronatus NRRL 28638]